MNESAKMFIYQHMYLCIDSYVSVYVILSGYICRCMDLCVDIYVSVCVFVCK